MSPRAPAKPDDHLVGRKAVEGAATPAADRLKIAGRGELDHELVVEDADARSPTNTGELVNVGRAAAIEADQDLTGRTGE